MSIQGRLISYSISIVGLGYNFDDSKKLGVFLFSFTKWHDLGTSKIVFLWVRLHIYSLPDSHFPAFHSLQRKCGLVVRKTV